MPTARTVRRSLFVVAAIALIVALIWLASAAQRVRTRTNDAAPAVARETTDRGERGHTARLAPWRATPTEAPDPGPPYVAAWVVSPPPPDPAGAAPLPVVEPLDPVSFTPPAHNPNGVDGRRPPRPIAGVTR